MVEFVEAKGLTFEKEKNQEAIANQIINTLEHIDSFGKLKDLLDGIKVELDRWDNYKERKFQTKGIALSRLRLREVRGDGYSVHYRETNDSEKIAKAIFKRTKELLKLQGDQLKNKEEYLCIRGIFDRKISRISLTNPSGCNKLRKANLEWLENLFENHEPGDIPACKPEAQGCKPW